MEGSQAKLNSTVMGILKVSVHEFFERGLFRGKGSLEHLADDGTSENEVPHGREREKWVGESLLYSCLCPLPTPDFKKSPQEAS